MKQITYYEAEDGTHFDSAQDAEKHDFDQRVEPVFQAYRERIAAAETFAAFRKIFDALLDEARGRE